jgi:peptide/nickel transport system ATP-binding protein
MPLLEVRNLKKHYLITEGLLKNEVGRVRAVDGVSFTVERGETLGIVGESGCGKSTTATTTLRLEEPTAGQVLFDGEDITGYDNRELKRFRRRAQMIFQDPTSSFDPRMSVGDSVAEPLVIHGVRDRDRRRRVVGDLLERVGLSADDYDRYPHEFSGGQRQRIALARALVVNPDLVVADEPTSALDVSVQAEILSLIERVQAEFGLSILFISHDMGIIREVCDRVAVMYLGEIVEIGPTAAVFDDPQHPYTRALLSSIPKPDPRSRGLGTVLTGDVPDPSNPPAGCRFHTRCPEIIPPDEYDLPPEEWRAVMNLRVRLGGKGIDVESVREFAAAEAEAGTETENEASPAVDDAAVAAAVRDEFGIPASLSDPGAERVLDEAIERLLAGDEAAARDHLAEAFPTVCARERPTFVPTDADHEAACHLHDPEHAPDPGRAPRGASMGSLDGDE